MDNETTVTFHGATRRTNSPSGNPRWTLHTSEGDYATANDSQLNYAVTNRTGGPGSWIGRRVTLTLNGRNQVTSWRRADENTER